MKRRVCMSVEILEWIVQTPCLARTWSPLFVWTRIIFSLQKSVSKEEYLTSAWLGTLGHRLWLDFYGFIFICNEIILPWLTAVGGRYQHECTTVAEKWDKRDIFLHPSTSTVNFTTAAAVMVMSTATLLTLLSLDIPLTQASPSGIQKKSYPCVPAYWSSECTMYILQCVYGIFK